MCYRTGTMADTRTVQSKPSFEDALKLTHKITLNRLGGYDLYQDMPTTRVPVTYTKAEIDSVDARIIAVLRMVYVKESANVLRASIAYWKEAPLPCVERTLWIDQDTPVVIRLALKKVLAVERIHWTDRIVYCQVENYRLNRTVEHIDYADRQFDLYTEALSFDWMEQHFPGVLERVKTACALGLEPTETADYAFYYQGTTQAVDLPAILSQPSC